MLLNYIIMTYRNLIRHWLFSLINIVGLTIGLLCCLLIWLFIQNETGYDGQFTDAERLYRVTTKVQRGGGQDPIVVAITSPSVGPSIKANFTVVDDFTRLMMGSHEFKYKNKSFNERVFFAQENYFELFDFKVLKGSIASSLTRPGSVVMTENRAIKYFGSAQKALGKNMTVGNKYNAQVTAVIADLPKNTHFAFNVLLSMDLLRQFKGDDILEDWTGRSAGYTFIRLKPGQSITPVVDGMRDFVKNNIPNPEKHHFELQPVGDIHLYSDRKVEMKPNGDINVIYTMAIVALVILLMACFNYINLSTAIATIRAKEVGVRKVLGANRKQLILQFMTESAVMTVIAIVLALIGLTLVLPAFNNFLGMTLLFDWTNPEFWQGIVVIGIFVMIFGGGYSAFYLSSMDPISALRSAEFNQGQFGGTQIRQILVILQFAASVILIVSTLVVYAQISFAKNIDMGYNKENMMIVYGANNSDVQQAYEVMKKQWQQHPGVLGVTASAHTPPVSIMGRMEYKVPSMDLVEFDYMNYNAVDFDFFNVYGIDVVAGRVFSADKKSEAYTSDQGAAVVLSELAIKQMGWDTPQQAIGQNMIIKSHDGEREVSTTIIGVVKDIHMSSVHDTIHPQLYIVMLPYINDISIRIDPSRQEAATAHIRQIWNEKVPLVSWFSGYVDVGFDSVYRDEENRLKLFTSFSILAVIVALMGLFGLAMFTAQRRVKEIGVRKVLGASLLDIVRLLTWDFSKLVVMANVLGAPVAYYIMSQWLATYSYHVSMSPLIFIGVVVGTLALSFVTIASQAIRVGRMSPILSLRDE
jgi:putative ABC transport system permease protein